MKRKYRLTTKTDAPHPIEEMSERHIALLNIFDRYDYLPWPWLHALSPLSGDQDYFRKMCKWMMKEPNKLLVLPAGQIVPGTLHQRHAVYARANKARTPYNAHNLLINVIRASLEYGCIKVGYRLVTWREFIDNPRVDPDVREKILKHKTLHLELSRDEEYEPDDCLIIDYGKNRYRYLFIEADRGTEPLISKSKARHKTIESMFEQMRTVSDRKLFRNLGFTHALFLVVTTDPVRMRSMMELKPPKYILFQSVPDWQPFATDSLLTNPWKVQGQDDFNMMEPPNVR